MMMEKRNLNLVVLILSGNGEGLPEETFARLLDRPRRSASSGAAREAWERRKQARVAVVSDVSK